MKDQPLIFGIHAVQTALSKHPRRVSRLIILQERQDQKMQALMSLAEKNKIRIDFVSRVELDRLAKQENHQGVVAFCETSKAYSESDLEKILADVSGAPLLLILDNVQDPHNLGACLRSADAAGVDVVIAPKDKSVGLTPVVSKVACGAAETVPFVAVTNLARTLRFLKDNNIWIFGADAEGEKNLYQADLTVPLAIVLGAEGTGLRRLTRDHCDMLLSVPMRGVVSSLNVSVAAGVFLFETLRQRC